MTPFPHLFQPYQLNPTLTLPNRIIMAPLTRCMAGPGLVPNEKAPAYYARRAGAGLIISEATLIRPDAQGYPDVPGIFTAEQIKGWQGVTQAVHEAGGRIFLQLWHVGRISHPFYLGGEAPIAPSAVTLTGKISRAKDLFYGTPRALDEAEIPPIVEAYAQAAENAISAGCDGIEIHGANGYLLDQFLHAHTNRRNDAYGGSVEKRVRFPLDVIDAICARIGSDRVGIRLSPAAYFFMEHHEEDVPTFLHFLEALASRHLAYVHTGIFDDSVHYDYLNGGAGAFLRRHYKGTVMGCGSYTPQAAEKAIAEGAFHLMALGRPFLANPDLVEKLAQGQPILDYDAAILKTLY